MFEIHFTSKEEYFKALRELGELVTKKGSLTADDINSRLAAHSNLESVLAKPDTHINPGQQITKELENAVKDCMNECYFGLRTRPDYSRLNRLVGKKEDVKNIIFGYFQQLIEDKPEIIKVQPEGFVSETAKLLGAFGAYADFEGIGYSIMDKHNIDSNLGKKIIARLEKSQFTGHTETDAAGQNYFSCMLEYILGDRRHKKIKEKYGDVVGELSSEVVNGQLKKDIIGQCREKYQVK